MLCLFQVYRKVIQLYIYVFQVLFPYRLLQNIELEFPVLYSSLPLMNVLKAENPFYPNVPPRISWLMSFPIGLLF